MARALLIAVAAGLLAAGAPKEADITGAWSFVTQKYAEGCRLTGAITIGPKQKSGAHACTFVANETCPSIKIRAEETCMATRTGDTLTIKSVVKSVKPSVGYSPDDFELKIESRSFMRGMMRSFNDAPVEFHRGDAPVS